MKKLDKIIENLYLKQPGNLAYYDSLTGVKNRTYYDREIRPTYCVKECYVTYVDVDNLKSVNDRFGHSAGDELIISVARQLKGLGANEVCRIGGDEFVLMSEQNIVNDIEKLKGASFGIYKKSKYEDISSGVAKADKACRRRKQPSISYDLRRVKHDTY